jgi:colicin import membrane protein
MVGTQETSVLFSLKQLQVLEEQRMREEEQAAAERAMVERIAREEAARIAAEAVERQAREAAERKAREETRKREEAARLEALRLAEIERARVEVETQARLEMMRNAEAHEKALVALREDKKKKRLQRALLSSVVSAVVLIGGGAGLYFGKIKPESEERLRSQAAEINALDEETSKLRNKLDQNGKRIQDVEARLAEATSKTPEPAAPPEPPTRPQHKLPPKQPDTKTPKGQCMPGDPGCDLNGNRLF